MSCFGSEFWLSANKSIVTVDGLEYVLQCSLHNAIYPYPRTVLSVYADPLDKNSPEYIKSRDWLHGHWSVDVLNSEDFCIKVIEQLLPSKEPAKTYAEVI